MKSKSASEEGSGMILSALAMLVLLTFVGMILDGGMLFFTKSELQKTANAAALSGAQELTEDNSTVTAIVHDVLQAHHEEQSLHAININEKASVRVRLKKDVRLVFSKLFGMKTVSVQAEAAAEIGAMAKAGGAAPLGIDDSIPLEFNKEYKLKVDQSNVDTGYFGILALGGTGAKTYEENLRSGYQNEIKVGDILETQTGNVAGKTRSVIDEKMLLCPGSLEDAVRRDCERILLIPVYKPYVQDSNQLKKIKITGFAYFFITAPMDPKDTSISGMFIKRTGTGYIDHSVTDNGAYSIRLTE